MTTRDGGGLLAHAAHVKYTDVDYVVISNAARAYLAGGSPYDEPTYKYSPLL